jgi:hypothetical protein
MEENVFSLRYEGKDISEGLEPIAFSEAMRGFADFITTVTQYRYGDTDGVLLKVHRLSEGSLVLQLLQQIGDIKVNDLIGAALSITTEVHQAIELLKHLRGHPPAKLVPSSDNRVAVENNSGTMMVFNHSAVHLVINNDLGATAERFSRPVSQGQAASLQVEVNSEKVATVTSGEVGSMVSVTAPQDLLENETELWVTTAKVVLQGEAKWTFTDGRRPFNAQVADPAFLAGVISGRERFGNGDRLRVRMRTKQVQKGTRLHTQYEITKVLEHSRPSTSAQISLF